MKAIYLKRNLFLGVLILFIGASLLSSQKGDIANAMDPASVWTEHANNVVAKEKTYPYHGEILSLENPSHITGDVNADGLIDLGDLLYLISYLYKGGPAPDPLEAGDVDDNGMVDLGDVLYLISYLYKGGPAPGPPTGILLSYSGCKEFQKGAPTDSVSPDQDCIEYQYDGLGLLLLKHVNAGFNCCPDEILADITIEDNIITIEENESLESGGCYCLCLFDVDYQISNLPPGEYTIRVYGMYLQEGDEILQFTVDLASSPSGIFCVYRDHYPWGIW